MTLYLAYVLAGLAIATPVGPITIEMIRQGLKNGFMHGWAVGLGGMSIDFILILTLYFGLASILQIPFIQIPMWLIGAVFLSLIAYDSIKHADKDITLPGEKSVKSIGSSYRNGFLVAISPGNIIFWLSVFGAVLADSYTSNGSTSFLIIATGVLTGILLHDIGLLTIVATSRKIMSKSMIKAFSIGAGVILIGFSGYFIYKFLVAITVFI